MIHFRSNSSQRLFLLYSPLSIYLLSLPPPTHRHATVSSLLPVFTFVPDVFIVTITIPPVSSSKSNRYLPSLLRQRKSVLLTTFVPYLLVLHRNSLKRKSPPDDDSSAAVTTIVLVDEDIPSAAQSEAAEQDDFRNEPRGSHTPPRPQGDGEYDAGAALCEFCHKKISIRDESTGKLCYKQWTQHRETWQVFPELHSHLI